MRAILGDRRWGTGLGVLAAACLLAVGGGAWGATRRFDLPAQDALTGIPAFARQAGVQILVSEAAVRGRRTGVVMGDLPLEAALARLLAGAGLAVTSNDGRTLTLGPQALDDTTLMRPTAPARLSEVVVTALRRTQRAQDVPAWIDVREGESLRGYGAQDLRDYLTAAPGVTYSENSLRGMRVTIRGISDGLGTTDPLSGIYIDEAPVTETFLATLDPDIYDVERVEVLKGPQGTLYGSGSMGGTVRIIGKKPKLDAYEATVDGTAATIDHGSWDRRVDGVVNLPIVHDRVALRVSAGYRDDGGWIDDLPRSDKNANGVEKRNVRAQVLLKPGDDTSVILGFLYQKEVLGLPWFADLTAPGPYQSDRIYRQSGGSEARLYSLTLRHDWAGMNLISATNYLNKEAVDTYDISTAVRPLLARILSVNLGQAEGVGLSSASHLDLFTQEVRLASAGPSRFDWLVGAFYSKSDARLLQAADVSQAPLAAARITGDGVLRADQRYGALQTAAFGELTFNATERLSLTGGLRVFDVGRRNRALNTGLLSGGGGGADLHANLASATEKFLVKYQPDRDHMIYAQAVGGYRNGGPNDAVSPEVCGSALAALGYTSIPPVYRPDRLWNYELGSKNTLLGGRMTLNGAIFHIDWSNIQSSVGLSCGSSFTVNAGRAVSQGVEIEARWKPRDGLTLSGAASYVDATLRRVAPGVAAAEGDRLPLTAKWSWDASAKYERPLGDALTGFLWGDVNYVGDRWNTFRGQGPTRAALMGGYTALNARVCVRTREWTLAVFGANLTDARIVESVNLPVYELVGRPRTVGVNARLGF